ncbi:TIGR03086 family metal-binding protein [Streptomyces sp. ODS28]|uniref:TIGR03086 family metal-binding protein n=1 Tax=Streptomyces sp. ODS28 TaxID=3136688 RepID=UPI0031E5FE4F
MDEAVDFTGQTRLVAALAERVPDARLEDPTPCGEMAVRHLLGHLTVLAGAFAAAGRKDFGPQTDTPPDTGRPDLDARWREELPERLAALAQAWRDPKAWEGETRAGGFDMPAPVAGRVAVNELVLHGWDLARATGQPYAPDEAALRLSYELVAATPEGPERAGMFGPVVPVPEDAPLLDRVLGLSGRHPDWTAPR